MTKLALSDTDAYLFDLRGYMIVPDAITPEQVDRFSKTVSIETKCISGSRVRVGNLLDVCTGFC